IPPAGQITVTATCQTLGAVAAPSGAIDTIATPTLGWQSVGNPIAAAVGLPIETDRQLRQRQALSTALPAQTILEALVGALFAVT
ncbi:baseplate J/gp47 family protein, partial [Escherichia coli]